MILPATRLSRIVTNELFGQPMRIRTLPRTLLIVALHIAVAIASQAQGLNAGTVTAKVGGAPFSAVVSIAALDDKGKLALSNLSNQVQIQVPKARTGKFEIKLDADGGLIDVIVVLKVGRRIISPVSGSLTIDALSASSASGRFEFDGKDVGSESPVKVTEGRFEVRFTGK